MSPNATTAEYHYQASTAPTGARQAKRNRRAEDAANDHFFQAAVNAAKTRTYRAVTSAGLNAAERQDLLQEILLDIIERQGEFDPARGAPGTFTGFVSAHRTAEYLVARKADRARLIFAAAEDVDTLAVVAIDRAINSNELSESAANDEEGRATSLYQADATATCWGDDSDLFSQSHTLHDLQTALMYLNGEQQTLFQLLASHQDLPEAAKASGMSTATFYRRVEDLRMHLRMFGIRPAA